eukprot:NODE_2402_length_1187_cov_20.703774_g2288_i0.p1 GENE.NODE_2402_length_1187_cov_20.703774_g2288_i0~~NODE_2402_length_1187_cov_20.703774_g2288_i0.p1  ORF type:complete len:392 (-),score=91.68 NODE_2402_length_1187_cov_20.703774_g2288_i0:11-1039(-)
MNIKLIDFGVAALFDPTAPVFPGEFTELCGTPQYVAPEIIHRAVYQLGPPYNFLCDIWSIGIIIYSLLAGDFPFDAPTAEELFKRVVRSKLLFEDSVWDSVTQGAKDFITTLLTPDPTRRPTAFQCLRHSWLKPTTTSNAVHRPHDFCAFNVKRKWRKALLTVCAARRLSFPPPAVTKSRSATFPSITSIPQVRSSLLAQALASSSRSVKPDTESCEPPCVPDLVILPPTQHTTPVTLPPHAFTDDTKELEEWPPESWASKWYLDNQLNLELEASAAAEGLNLCASLAELMYLSGCARVARLDALPQRADPSFGADLGSRMQRTNQKLEALMNKCMKACNTQ